MKPIVNKALAVGVLAAITGLAFLIALTFFRRGGYSEDESYLVHAFFGDATGLTWKSRVQIAGIQIGEIDEISLEGARARLDLRIRNDILLRTDACVTKTFPSALLPDAVLEASPGTEEKPLLKDLPVEKRNITCIRSAATAQQVMDAMATIATDVQAITGDLAKTVSGNQGSLREIVENLARITGQVDDVMSENGGALRDILVNTRTLTGDLAEMSSREKDRVHSIARNIEGLTSQLRVVVASVQQIIDPEAGGPGPNGTQGAPGAPGAPGGPGPGAVQTPEQRQASAEARGIRQSLDRLNSSLTRLDEIVASVGEGKSAAGRLLVDERLGRQLGNAVDNVSDYLDRVNKLQIQLQLRSEWLLNQTFAEGRPGSKIYFSARLLPRPDKYYLLELVSDPRGVDKTTTETINTVITDPNGAPISATQTTATRRLNEEKLTFSFQLAKRYGPLTFRIGIIEGSGGAGTDLHLLNDSLQLSASIYQFSRAFQGSAVNVDRAVYPRAKVWLNYYFLQHFFVTTGVDDFLNQWQTGRYPGGRLFNVGTDVFFGGGVYFTDDDLKTLIGAGAGSVAGAMP